MSFDKVMDSGYLLIMLLIVVVGGWMVYLYTNQCCGKDEKFWGGWMPVNYLDQPVPLFGRLGIDAFDAPKLLINQEAQPINPCYCPNCQGYRCCDKK